jgi:hypothetical protein
LPAVQATVVCNRMKRAGRYEESRYWNFESRRIPILVEKLCAKTLLVADPVVCRYEANPSIVSHAHPKKMPLSQNSRVLHVLIHRLLHRPKVRISATFNRVTVEEGASYSKAPSHHADHLRMR